MDHGNSRIPRLPIPGKSQGIIHYRSTISAHFSRFLEYCRATTEINILDSTVVNGEKGARSMLGELGVRRGGFFPCGWFGWRGLE